ncbi:MAG: hypothetical protein AAGN66_12915 [Acidobacteriota bacterium]
MNATADGVPHTLPDSPHAPTSPFGLLRDRARVFQRIADGQDLVPVMVRCLATAGAGAAILGMALGSYAHSAAQILASTLKLPILLLGTALLCFPAFHVLQSWRAPRPMSLQRSLTLQSLSLAAVALVWGSLAPPILFLVGSTQHYRLTQSLAVLVCAFGGLVGLSVLLTGYRELCDPEQQRPSLGLLLYVLVFGAVGGQLAWILRPFVGSPALPFQLFRAPNPEDGNFFLALLDLLGW